MYSLTSMSTILRDDGANIPVDPANSNYREYLAWVAAGNTAKPYVASVTSDEYAFAIQDMINQTVKARGYNDGVSLASYANSTNPQWVAEANAFLAWRDKIWEYAYQQLALIQSGKRTQPSVPQLIAELPIITWP